MNEAKKLLALAVKREIERRIGDNAKVFIEVETKNNGVETIGVAIRKGSQKVVPVIWIDEQLEDVKNSFAGIGDVAEYVITASESDAVHNFPDTEKLLDKSFVLANIEYRLVNYDKNAQSFFEEKIPHKKVLDLAVTYRIALGENFSALVNEQIMRAAGIEFEELDKAAMKNTATKGFVLENVAELLDFPDHIPMYTLTNKSYMFGAVALLYTDQYKALANLFDADLYVIPSSVHEVLILPAIENPASIKQLIRNVNGSKVSEEDFLSNELYVYRKEKGALERVVTW